jgi:hypothetical protein
MYRKTSSAHFPNTSAPGLAAIADAGGIYLKPLTPARLGEIRRYVRHCHFTAIFESK